MANDTIGKTFTVAALICIVCSVLVSTAAVKLKPLQDRNKEQFKRTNILKAAGLLEEGKTIDELFNNIEVKYIDLETGDFNETINPQLYNAKAALKNPSLSKSIKKTKDIAGIKSRVITAEIYFVKSEGKLKDIYKTYGVEQPE